MNADELKVLENALAVIETLQTEIEKLKEDNTELQRLFDKAMDGWAKDKSK